MSKYLMKALCHGAVILDNVQCKKGDVFVVETLGRNWPNIQDIAKSTGKKYCGGSPSVPDHGWDSPAPGKTYKNYNWEITVLEY